MKDVCLIPCYSRPEFLELCLKQILAAKGTEDILFLFQVDFGYNRRIDKVIDRFPLEKAVRKTAPIPHTASKLSNNILQGYRNAWDMCNGQIFMIEEDVMIADDFFNWHRKAQEERQFFCSIASKNNNLNRYYTFDDDAKRYYTSHCTYQSLGVCFDAWIMEHEIMPLIDEFLRDRGKFCQKTFPNSQLGSLWSEQAGFIRRIQEAQDLPIAYPHLPRAFHAGFYGKNRSGDIKGPEEGKADRIEKIIFNPQEMENHSMNTLYYMDSEPINLKTPKYNKVIFSHHYKNEPV